MSQSPALKGTRVEFLISIRSIPHPLCSIFYEWMLRVSRGQLATHLNIKTSWSPSSGLLIQFNNHRLCNSLLISVSYSVHWLGQSGGILETGTWGLWGRHIRYKFIKSMGRPIRCKYKYCSDTAFSLTTTKLPISPRCVSTLQQWSTRFTW